MSDSSDAEFQQVLRDLRQHLANCGPEHNERDRAYIIIGYCIVAELNTKLRICQMAKALGKNTRQVAAVLDDLEGKSPGVHSWYLDRDGRYLLH